MSLIEVNELTVTLGRRRIIDRISFSVDAGLTMLLGRNGAGKSTLIKAMLGFIPCKGQISIGGNDIRRLNSRKRAQLVSYLPQHQAIPSGTSVQDYVAMGAFSEGRLLSAPGKEVYTAALNELNALGIGSLAQRNIETLSGGEAKLAALARTRIQNSIITLMDEPLAGLDFVHQHEFLARTRAEGRPVLMSIHDPMLAWQYGTNILVLDDSGINSYSKTDAGLFEKKLKEVYGNSINFEHTGSMIIPVWHD